MIARRRIFLALTVLLAVLAVGIPGRGEERGPRELVVAFMDALKHRDLATALTYVGLDLPEPAARVLPDALDRQNLFQWAVKDYAVKSVRVDGGLAVVTVEELRFVDVAASVRARLSQLGAFADAVHWGDSRVTERFILIRPDKRWIFDSCHSGIAMDALPLKDIVESASQGGPPSPELQARIGAFLNNVGFGQLVQSLGSSGPMVPLVAGIAIPNFVRARSMGQVTACKSNLKNIGTALEMYSTDNAGRFPTGLGPLVPNYLRVMPTCPSAGRDTYSRSYEAASNPDAYTVCCEGPHHAGAGLPPDYPKYTSTQGLLTP